MSILRKIREWLDRLLNPPKEEEERIEFSVKEPAIVSIEVTEPRKTDITYPLLDPFAHAQIRWSESEKALVYRVLEPRLKDEEKAKYEKILSAMIKLVDVQLSSIKDREKVSQYISEGMGKALKELGLRLTDKEKARIMYYLFRNFAGLNELEPLMHDTYIEDVGVDGMGVPVYIVHKKFGSLKTNIVFNDEEQLQEFVIKLAERCGRFISYAEPILDGTLPDGTRVQATLSKDVTTRGATVSLRKFSKEPLSPVELIDLNTASPELMAYLWFCVEHGSSILICGGVASGKTTMLNAISLFIQPESKIVTIEDTRELNLPHENWIPSVTRMGFGPPMEGKRYGDVTMFDLLKASFRQNPNYVIVGEIRGAEAHVMFQGMASGNPSMGTMHADGLRTAVKRLMTAPINLPPATVESLDLVITMAHVREKGASARRIKLMEEIQRIDGEDVYAAEVFSWSPSSDTFDFKGSELLLSKIARVKGLEMADVREDIKERQKVLEWMKANRLLHWKEAAKIISQYTKDRQSLMRRIDGNG